MGSERKVLWVALSVSFLCVLLLVILANRKISKATINATPSTRSFNLLKQLETEWSALHQNLNLNSVSKRRIPSGPDPIHNRRAGNSRLPPTRA